MGKTIARKGSYWNRNLSEVYDGNLHIKLKYLENGVNDGDPSGWYTSGIDTGASFNQTYGYFETRCILPAGYGLWSAFWMFSPGVSSAAVSGVTGAEIDVFESPYYDELFNNKVSANIHVCGYEENHRSLGATKCHIKGNPYKDYNTYAVEWNHDSYIFYINGQKWYETDFGGVSQSDEYLILSVEVDGDNGVPSTKRKNINNNKAGNNFETEFIVDYVRAYQYKSE